MRVAATHLLCLLLTFAGFAAHAQSTGKSAAEVRSFGQVLNARTLRVGVFPATPYVMKGGDGKLMGAEIDVAERLAKDMGGAAQFREYTQWEQLIPALQRGEIDIIVSGFSITPERALQVAFSNPYASSGIGIATNTKLTSQFNSLDNLNKPDVAIAVVGGTVSEQVARDVFGKASIKVFTEEAKAEESLVKGLVHAYVRSEPAPRFLALRFPNEVDVPVAKPLVGTREAFAVRKGEQEFVNFLNAWIVAREADEWLGSTRRYWFDNLSWQDKVAK